MGKIPVNMEESALDELAREALAEIEKIEKRNEARQILDTLAHLSREAEEYDEFLTNEGC